MHLEEGMARLGMLIERGRGRARVPLEGQNTHDSPRTCTALCVFIQRSITIHLFIAFDGRGSHCVHDRDA